MARVAPVVSDVVADRQQLAAGVVEEAVVHPRHAIDHADQAIDDVEPVASSLRAVEGGELAQRRDQLDVGAHRGLADNGLFHIACVLHLAYRIQPQQCVDFGLRRFALSDECVEPVPDLVVACCVGRGRAGVARSLCVGGRDRQFREDIARVGAQASEPARHRLDRRRSRVVRRFEVAPQLDELARDRPHIAQRQHAQRIGQPFEHAQVNDLPVGQLDESRAQHEQVSREIAAVDGGYVARLQRLQRLRVVPVQEVVMVALEVRHRLQRIVGALDQLPGSDVAEVISGEIRQQRHPHVGRRCSMRDNPHRMFLVIVRRQPVVFGSDEGLEESPCLARHCMQVCELLGAEFQRTAAARPADPPADRGCRYPQHDDRRCDEQRIRPLPLHHHRSDDGQCG